MPGGAGLHPPSPMSPPLRLRLRYASPAQSGRLPGSSALSRRPARRTPRLAPARQHVGRPVGKRAGQPAGERRRQEPGDDLRKTAHPALSCPDKKTSEGTARAANRPQRSCSHPRAVYWIRPTATMSPGPGIPSPTPPHVEEHAWASQLTEVTMTRGPYCSLALSSARIRHPDRTETRRHFLNFDAAYVLDIVAVSVPQQALPFRATQFASQSPGAPL